MSTMPDWFAELELSDTEEPKEEVTFETAREVMIPFGKKHRGKKLGDLLRSKSGRSYLRYLLEWDNLYDDMRANIDCVLTEYGKAKAAAAQSSPKKKRKRN